MIKRQEYLRQRGAHRPSHIPGLPQGLPDGVCAKRPPQSTGLCLRQVCEFHALKGCCCRQGSACAPSNPASLCLNSSLLTQALPHSSPNRPSSLPFQSLLFWKTLQQSNAWSTHVSNLLPDKTEPEAGELLLHMWPSPYAVSSLSCTGGGLLIPFSTDLGQVPCQPLLKNIFQGQPQPTPDTQKGKRTSWATRQIIKNIYSYHSFRNFYLISLSVSVIWA